METKEKFLFFLVKNQILIEMNSFLKKYCFKREEERKMVKEQGLSCKKTFCFCLKMMLLVRETFFTQSGCFVVNFFYFFWRFFLVEKVKNKQKKPNKINKKTRNLT